MKNRLLRDLLEGFDDEADVKVRASIVLPEEWEDASEEDQLIDDGDLLVFVDERAVLLYNSQEIHIIADKVFEE